MGNQQSSPQPSPSPQPSSIKRKVAVLLIGNSGVGKSALLSQLGATSFKSGARFRKGFTKEVHEEEVELSGERVLLIDVPGLYEPSEKETNANAEKLTEALSRGYDYKLYFVMLASNRGPSDQDLVIMSRINKCIKRADDSGSRYSFRVIVNQIKGNQVYNMYQEELARDCFKSLFNSLVIPDFSFDIEIESVMLLRYNEAAIRNKKFATRIADDVTRHSQYAINMRKLKASKTDLNVFHRLMMHVLLAAVAAAEPAVLVVGAAAWAIYQTVKVSRMKKLAD